MPDRRRALITGPTSGIGRSFATLLASQGYDLVLVSRDEERLNQVASELADEHGVAVEVLRADLSVKKDLAKVEKRLSDEIQPVEVLINNAGFGVNQSFTGGKLTAEQHLIDVLITAVMRLSHAAAESMVSRGRGHIVVVSSVAGFIAGSTYSAAKSWATVFAESLHSELSPHGVMVSALCPGFTRTEFHSRAAMSMNWLPSFLWLDSDALVRKGWRDHHAGRAVSVPGWQYRALPVALRLLPRGVVRGGIRRPTRRD